MKTEPILVAGDMLALLIVTLIGFVTHGEISLASIPRIGAVFFPLVLSWLLIAPWFGLFDSKITSNPRMIWRPVLAFLFAGPLAVALRGWILSAPFVPVFAVVLSATSALGLEIWRALYLLWHRPIRGRP